jgi:Uma2 family endonuclease
LLLIEVADTTLEYDRDAKIPTYAQHAIPEVWLVNVQTNSLSIFRDPSPKGYRRLVTPQAGDDLIPHLLPSVRVVVTEIFS